MGTGQITQEVYKREVYRQINALEKLAIKQDYDKDFDTDLRDIDTLMIKDILVDSIKFYYK